MRFPASIIAILLLAMLTTASARAAGDLRDISSLASQGKHEQALEQVNTYLEDNPGDVQGLFLRGVILAELNRADDAIKVFSGITERHPELPEPYNNLAVLYAEQGQYEKARNALEKAIRTHPSYATAHENLGDIYAKMATEAYDKALQLDKGNTRAQTKLALVKDLFPSNGTAAPADARPAKAAKPAPVKPAEVAAKKTPADKPAPAASEPVVVLTPAKAAQPAPPPAADKPTAAADKPTADVAEQQAIAAVTDSVHSWAKAWAAQDVDAYLAHYARDFKPTSGESRRSWEETRRKRVSAPASITVEVSKLKVVSIDDKQARVSFSQRYKAGSIAQRTAKILVMQKNGDKWLIEQELVGR